MRAAVIVNGTPIVQAGCYYKAVGELVVRMEGRKRHVISYGLLPGDDTILGDPVIAEEMVRFTAETSRIVFAARGLRIDEPLAVVDCDWSNSFLDLEASRALGNITADASRQATNADVGLNAAGMVRAGLTKGTSGIQTAYDVFLIAPLGLGVEDQSAGGSLIVTYLTGRELKNCLEFLLAGNPNQPGQYFPRVSGMRFRYDMSRPNLDVVTQIELGNLAQGYRAIDLSESAEKLYGIACNLYLGIMLISFSKKTGLPVVPKNSDGSRLRSRADALPTVQSGPYMLPPKGQIDKAPAVHGVGTATSMEIKEWQAIMNYLKGRPTKNEKGVTMLAMDDAAKENRSVDTSAERVHV